MPNAPDRLIDVFNADGRGLQHNGLRRANERAVMSIIAFNSGVSNADISRLSGLAPQTVSAILVDLDMNGLISRGEVVRGRRGQPATPLFLRSDGAYSVGCELGWRHLDVIVIDMYAQVLGHVHHDYDFPDARTVPDAIAAATAEVLSHLSANQRARVCGLGVAMPTDLWRHLHFVSAPDEQEQLWRDLDLSAALAERTGLDISIYNDGNAACWGELIASPKPRPGDFIYLSISSFVAAGIVGEGTLWEGSNGNSANLGSMLVSDCEGKLQILQFVASITALTRKLKAAGIPTPQGAPPNWDWPSFEPVLTDWIEAASAGLARVIFNTSAVIESRLAIIDGALPRQVLTRLVARTAHHVETLPVSSFTIPQVRAGSLGAMAPVVGAAELPLYKRYFSRTIADIVS